MTITLKLKPETEQKLLAQAAAAGLAVETFLEQLVEARLSQQSASQPTHPPLSYEEWETLLSSFTESPAFAEKPLLSDAAIDRENIYTKDDELPRGYQHLAASCGNE
ncbi:MAG: hypothetical protein LH647_01045 [Leptolyngbyaceae cyanobacterium CAN_BIN12]|nr:hypothetical protein [Leptolyngbyaceae cyanobacterium CAN_BIN12]